MNPQYDGGGSVRRAGVGTDHAAEAVSGFFTKFGDRRGKRRGPAPRPHNAPRTARCRRTRTRCAART
ncbi:hypothetical protein [Nonomuraea rubra]|uniref:hypothetical protein n=1 Tax=Nonomuraea rubra TaxID=46180 RepID=UPI003CD0931B